MDDVALSDKLDEGFQRYTLLFALEGRSLHPQPSVVKVDASAMEAKGGTRCVSYVPVPYACVAFLGYFRYRVR